MLSIPEAIKECLVGAINKTLTPVCASLGMPPSPVPWVSPSELRPDPHFPSYWLLGGLTGVHSARWRNTRVSLKERGEDTRQLTRELDVLRGLAHPHILLLMGHTQSRLAGLQLVFEHIQLGSLYICLHERPHPALGSLVSRIDVVLQVVEALVYLHGRGLAHTMITSHAVQLVSSRVAKLGQLEGALRLGVRWRPWEREGWESMVPWAAPELVLGGSHRAKEESDVYSLSCVLWEISRGEVPWQGREARWVEREVGRGAGLEVGREIPRYIRRVLRQGLLWEVDERDLELQEVRDMLLVARRKEEETSAGVTRRCIRRTRSELGRACRSALQTQITRYIYLSHDQ